MKRVGVLILAAVMAGASPALSQVSETEQFEGGANAMAGAQREVTQRNIDVATKALREKDYKTARKYAQSVTRADPKRVEAWLLLGSAQQGLQDWKGARLTYATAVRLYPTHPEARAGLGVAYGRTGDPKAAVQLAWLDAKLRECGGCYQSGQLTKLKADVETAIRETPAKSS